MKKILFFAIALFIMMFSSVVSAERDYRHHDWSHQAYHHESWHPSYYHEDENLPFRWHERRDVHLIIDDRRFMHERGWGERFPGLHPYSWHESHGFWYHGHRINDAVLFYNDSDELVSVGFWHEGVFVFIRDDHRSFENHDSFFLSWRR